MAAYRSEGATANIWFDPTAKSAEIDGLLAEAGYLGRASDLQQVHRSEERRKVLPPDPQLIQFSDSSTIVHGNNQSDLSGWVESMLSQISPPPARPLLSSATGDGERLQIQHNPFQYCQASTVQVPPATYQSQVAQMDFDSGIQLVHLLMTCGESVQRGDTPMAISVIDEMRSILLSNNINTTFGIGKVAGYFIDALTRRLFTSGGDGSRCCCDLFSTLESEILYQNFYEACPYLKFAHFTANQSILEAFDGHDCVHVIDFSLMHGLQWPALIQALALRPGGPPFLRITGIGPPSSDGRDSLREIGLRLADLSRSIGVGFAFRGVAANRLDDVKPWMLHVAAGPAAQEVVAVNSVMQLHRLLTDDVDNDATSINSVLGWIHDLKPKIITLVEQEADHNNKNFMDRFTESLFYYSTMFDSLDAGGGNNEQRGLAEVYLQREICNVLCCEGSSRTERHERLTKWRARMSGAGFKISHLGSNAYKQASMLLTLFSGDDYCVEEVDGCLMLGWHSRPLISASAWRIRDDVGNTNCSTADNSALMMNNNYNGGSSTTNSSSSTSSNNNNN